MSKAECPHCKREFDASGAFCHRCKFTLEVALVNVKAHHADMMTLRTGMTRYGRSAGRSSKSRLGMSLLFAPDGRGAEVETLTRQTIARWSRHVLDGSSAGAGPVCRLACLHVSCSMIRRSRPPLVRWRDPLRPGLDDAMVGSGCDYLLGWLDWLRASPAGLECLRQVLDVEMALGRLVDRPRDRWYAGVCSAELDLPHDGATCSCYCHDGIGYECEVAGGCGLEWHGPECSEHLYAKAEDGDVECPACGTVWPVQERRDFMLAAAENELAPASLIARAVTLLSDYSNDAGRLHDRIRKWAERNRIAAMTHERIDGRERPLYRIGAVLDLLAEDARQAEEKAARKSARRERKTA